MIDEDDYDARLDDEIEEEDAGEECGRWDNGRLSGSCRLAGTEFCDFECPYRDQPRRTRCKKTGDLFNG